MIRETDKAWLGGVMDSSQSSPFRNNKAASSGWVWTTTFKMTSVAERVSVLTGQKTLYQTRPWSSSEYIRRPCGEHCPEAHEHVRVSRHRVSIRVSGIRLAIVLFGVGEYLTRKEDFEVVSRWRDPKPNGNFWACVDSMKEIGWRVDIPILEGMKRLPPARTKEGMRIRSERARARRSAS